MAPTESRLHQLHIPRAVPADRNPTDPRSATQNTQAEKVVHSILVRESRIGFSNGVAEDE